LGAYLSLSMTMFGFRFLQVFLSIFIYGVASFSIAATPLTVKPVDKLTVKLYWPEDLDDKGKQVPITGPITKIFSYFEQEAGLKFEIIALPWKRAQLEVLQGKGILYGFSKTSERLGLYRYSQPVTTLHIWGVSYGTDNASLAEVKDLKGKIVASGVGIAHGLEYENARNNVFTVQEDYGSTRDRFKRLFAKRSDVILIPAMQTISREQLVISVNETLVPGFRDPELNGRRFEISLKPLFYDTIHFASGKTHFDEVIDRIDKVIQKGQKNGSLAKLYQ
jgi:polar amino acid transport system substrate-binding protein